MYTITQTTPQTKGRVLLAMKLLTMLLVLIAALPNAMGCCFSDNRGNAGIDDGTKPVSQVLPSLELRDDTADLLITWVDEKGDHHVVLHPTDVPEHARENVRIVKSDLGRGDLLYVADLRAKNADGTYPVKSMPRSEWELIAEQRRQKSMAIASPAASAGPNSPPSPRIPTAAPNLEKVAAIVYATSWCGVCKKAESYLRTQNVIVSVKDIEKSRTARAEMSQKLKKAGLPQDGSVPVIDIRGKILKGFVQRDIDRAIKDASRGDLL